MLTAFLCNLDSTSYFFVNEKTSLVNSHTNEIDSLADSPTGLSHDVVLEESFLVTVLSNFIIQSYHIQITGSTPISNSFVLPAFKLV